MQYPVSLALLLMSVYTLADPAVIAAENNQNTTYSFIESKNEIVEPKLSAAEAAAMVKKKFPGQVMNVTLQLDTALYNVKILSDGHMKTIYVDAFNGNASIFLD